jgi:hypothetical protein
MQAISYTRLFVDATGESHFARVEAELAAETDSPELRALAIGPAVECRVVGASPFWEGSQPHTSPRRQIFCTLRGEYEVTASDGTTQRFPPGRLLLLEDISGKGHTTRLTGGGDLLVLVVTLAS